MQSDRRMNTGTCYNTDETWEHYGKLNKKVTTKREILYNFIYNSTIFQIDKSVEMESSLVAALGWGSGSDC